jgi:uncharacterized protein YebE (UPF0316 family)
MPPLDLLFAAPLGALLIFMLRVADVSMAMMRMLLAVRGHRVLAAAIGFVEVLIWLVAVGKTIEYMHSIAHVIGYAGGFAAGNYVGIWLEERFALGTNVVHAVIRRAAGDVSKAPRALDAAHRLRAEGFAVTELEGLGLHSSVDILNVVVARRNASQVVGIIREADSAAFLSIEEVRSVEGGYVPPAARKMPSFLSLETLWRRPHDGLSVQAVPTIEVSVRETADDAAGVPSL